MSETKEFLMATYESNQNLSVCAYNYNTGNIENVYKNGGLISAKTLCQLGNDYIVTAEKDKPLLHVWPVNSAEQLKNVKFVLPEPAKVLAIHPMSNYLAVASTTKLYVWHLNSGYLLTVLQKHYLPISCVKFSCTGECLVTTGDDGMLITYKFSDVINFQSNYLVQSEVGRCEPLYSRTDNSSPILDCCLGRFGLKSRVTTVASDQTCRIYDLYSGDQLLVLIFDIGLSAVIFDSPCWNLYVGSEKGLINLINLKNPCRMLEYHVEADQSELKFVGHQKKITCLCLNIIGNILASASEDCSIIIWEVKSRNIFRKIEKSLTTNLTFIQSYSNKNSQILKPLVVLKSLQRCVENDIAKFNVALIHNEDLCFSDEENTIINENDPDVCLETELVNAKLINKQLYNAIITMSKKYNDVK